MKQEFEIVRADGGTPIRVTTDARDILVWERTNRRGRTAATLAQGVSMEDFYDLAFLAASRTQVIPGLTRKVFDTDYLVEPVGEDEGEDPTK